jgi:hypothetical protein
MSQGFDSKRYNKNLKSLFLDQRVKLLGAQASQPPSSFFPAG